MHSGLLLKLDVDGWEWQLVWNMMRGYQIWLKPIELQDTERINNYNYFSKYPCLSDFRNHIKHQMYGQHAYVIAPQNKT